VQIKHSVELPDGNYQYQGNVTGKELEFLVEYAINNLLMQGALPFLNENSETVNSLVMSEVNTEQ
jgi:hypothetical protein